MANNLFPVFDVPSEIAENTQPVKVYAPAPLWDFETGDFATNGAGQPIYGSGYDAWVLWCTKIVLTQRWAHDGYTPNTGIEAKEAFKEPDRKAQESALERTITEALMADPAGRTAQGRSFLFVWGGDSLDIRCEVVGTDGNSATVEALLRT